MHIGNYNGYRNVKKVIVKDTSRREVMKLLDGLLSNLCCNDCLCIVRFNFEGCCGKEIQG